MTDKPQYNTFEYDLHEVQKLLQSMQNRYDKQKKELDTSNPSLKPLITYEKVPYPVWYSGSIAESWFKHPNGYNSYSYGGREYKTVEALHEMRDKFLTEIDAVLSDENVESVRQQNLAIIEHNKMVAKRIETFMIVSGIPRTYQERDYKSKARYPKDITKSSGFIDDITRNVKQYDLQYDTIKKNVENAKVMIKGYVERVEASIKAAQQAQQAKERDQRRDLFLATMRVKYKLPFDADLHAVHDAIEDSENSDSADDMNTLWSVCPETIYWSSSDED